MNLNTRYRYSSKWDKIPPQAGKALTDSHRGVNCYTDHINMLQDISYSKDVYKRIGAETAPAWFTILNLKGNIEQALYQHWFRSYMGLS